MKAKQESARVFEKKKGSGVWWIDYRGANGKRHREKIGKKGEAMAVYSRRLKDIADGNFFAPGSQASSFRSIAAAAMEYKQVHVKPLSYETDKQRLKILLPMLGGISAEQLSAEKLEEVFAQLKRGGLSGSTVNRYRSLVSSIFSFALRRRLVRANPCQGVKKFKENPSRVRYLLKDEEKDLRRIIRLHFEDREPELDLALYTGMRRGEQFSLKWENVDLDNARLSVQGKTGQRYIIVNSSARAAIEQLKRLHGSKSEYVCSPDRGEDASRDWSRWFEQACRLAGVKNFKWHDLRHTFASRLAMKRENLRTIQELMGHASIVMTQRYAHLSPDHKAEAAEKIGREEETEE